MVFFFFKQKTAYEMRISDWSSDVCSSDLVDAAGFPAIYVHEHYHPRRRGKHRYLIAKILVYATGHFQEICGPFLPRPHLQLKPSPRMIPVTGRPSWPSTTARPGTRRNPRSSSPSPTRASTTPVYAN